MLVILFSFSLMLVGVSSEALLEAVYWEVKPYIFENEEGQLDGIIPMIFRQGQSLCMPDATTQLIDFKKMLPSSHVYYEMLRSSSTYNSTVLQSIDQKKAFWLPDVSYASQELAAAHAELGLQAFEMCSSQGLAVILPRYMVSLPNKMIRGIYSCQQILILALMLSVKSGLVIWLIERNRNNEFPPSFVSGIGTGIWWSIVSMTTVGYGDVVPRTILGRCVAVIWVIVGLMIACVMTATVTEIVTGVAGFSIYKMRVAVLENSVDLKIARDDFGADTVAVTSYTQALDYVREGKVFAALVNADIAAWYQEEIHNDSYAVPLRVVQVLERKVQIQTLIPLNLSQEAMDAFNCMFAHSRDVYDRSIYNYQKYCHSETLYIDHLSDLLAHNTIYKALLAAILVCFALGFMFEAVLWYHRRDMRLPHLTELLGDYHRRNKGILQNT